MYWIFRTDWIDWKGELQHAELVESPWEPLQKPEWWGNIPIPDPRPSFVFRIDSCAPFLDNYATGTKFNIYSEKLISLLKNMGVNFETFPASFFDKRSGEIVNLDSKSN